MQHPQLHRGSHLHLRPQQVNLRCEITTETCCSCDSITVKNSIKLVLPNRSTFAAYRQLHCPLRRADRPAMAMQLMPLLHLPLGLSMPHMVCAPLLNHFCMAQTGSHNRSTLLCQLGDYLFAATISYITLCPAASSSQALPPPPGPGGSQAAPMAQVSYAFVTLSSLAHGAASVAVPRRAQQPECCKIVPQIDKYFGEQYLILKSECKYAACTAT